MPSFFHFHNLASIDCNLLLIAKSQIQRLQEGFYIQEIVPLCATQQNSRNEKHISISIANRNLHVLIKIINRRFQEELLVSIWDFRLPRDLSLFSPNLSAEVVGANRDFPFTRLPENDCRTDEEARQKPGETLGQGNEDRRLPRQPGENLLFQFQIIRTA